ncbi:MAG TPA: hypothetical protein VF544_21245 [Pyrinomonadaceae bacterium]
MRLHLLLCTILALCPGGFAVASQVSSSRTIIACQSKDGSILKPTNTSYNEAMEFAQFLEGRGIIVKSVQSSKLNGFFQGLEKAGFFKTDKGIVEVIFFPEPSGAEKVRVRERRRAGRYLYSFEGQPHPNPPGDRIDAGRPMYFLMHRNWFMVTDSEELHEALKLALTEG